MTILSFVKMKNYLLFEVQGCTPESNLSINVAVSHREVSRISERLKSEASPYIIVARTLDSDGHEISTEDLTAVMYDDCRFFRIVPKTDSRQMLLIVDK